MIGFCLRVHHTGRRVYALRYNLCGKARIYTIGSHGSPWTADEARLKARELLIAIERGEDSAHDKQLKEGRRLKLATLIDRYLTDGPATKLEKRPRAWKTDASNLNRHIRPLLGSIFVGSVSTGDVSKAAGKIIEGGTAKTVRTRQQGYARIRGGLEPARRALCAGSAMYSWAIAQGLATNNPFKGVRLPRSDFKERYLSREEVRRLLAVLSAAEREERINSAFAACIRLLLSTGARKTEIVALRWTEVDLANNRLVLAPGRTKCGQRNGSRVIPLGRSATMVLETMPGAGEFVFPASKGGSGHTTGLQKAWTRVREEADLHDVRLHDLRHSFASFAMANKESIYLISRTLGHANTRTTERYLHVHDNDMLRLAERTGDFIMDAR